MQQRFWIAWLMCLVLSAAFTGPGFRFRLGAGAPSVGSHEPRHAERPSPREAPSDAVGRRDRETLIEPDAPEEDVRQRPATRHDVLTTEERLIAIVEGHSRFTAISALVQFVQILALSACWYFGLRVYHEDAHALTSLSRQRYVILPLLLSLYYTLLMREVYVPAVLVLAVAAIYFAAEHVSSLHTTETNLGRVTKDIQKASKDLQTLVALEDGEEWRFDIYRACAGRSWVGRMCYWDIDAQFLNQAKAALKPGAMSFDDYWRALAHVCARYTGRTNEKTLYGFMHAAAAASGFDRPDFGVRLMYDPPPMRVFFARSPSGTKALRDVMGFMFHFLVFEMVNRNLERRVPQLAARPVHEALPRLGYAKIRVGPHAPWIHVTGDDQLYEVFDFSKDVYGKTLVRDITRHSSMDTTSLAKHHRAALRRSLAIAGRGQAYLASFLLEILEEALRREEMNETPNLVARWVSYVRYLATDGTDELLWFRDEQDPEQRTELFARLFVLLAVGVLEVFRDHRRAIGELLGDPVRTSPERRGGADALLVDPLLVEVLR